MRNDEWGKVLSVKFCLLFTVNSLRSFTLLRLGIASELALLSLYATVTVYDF